MGYREFVAFMAVMSITIAAAIDVMLPAFDVMKESFGLDPGSNAIALTVTLYFVGMAVAQIFWGPLADHYGRKPILWVGLSIYAVGAAVSTLADSLSILLLGRFVWGIGAASARVMGVTIVRDVFQGDRMARVMSLVMSVFLLGPIIAPLVGEGLLQFGSWRYVFGLGLFFALATVLWTLRLDETLDPKDRLPLGFGQTRNAVRAVLASRQTLGHSFALTFVFGILLVFLGSSQLMFDEVYDRADQFALFFSLSSLFSAGAAYATARMVERIGSEKMATFGAAGFVVAAGAMTAVSLTADGKPSFWLWFGLLSVIMALVSVVLPTSNSLAMEPMGRLAGTASAVIGTMSMGLGSVLGAVVDTFLEESVTPMAMGFLVFGTLTLASVLWARRGAELPLQPTVD